METLCSWLLVHVEKWMYDMGYCIGGWIYDVYRRHDGKLMYDMCHHVGKWMYDMIRHDGKLMYDMCHHVGKCIFDMCCHFGKSMFDTSVMSDNNYVTNVMSAMNFRRICHVSNEFPTNPPYQQWISDRCPTYPIDRKCRKLWNRKTTL